MPFDQIMIAAVIAGLLAALALFILTAHPIWSLIAAVIGALTLANYAIPPVTMFQQVPGFGGSAPLGVVTLSGASWVVAGIFAVGLPIAVALLLAIPQAWATVTTRATSVGSGFRAMVTAAVTISENSRTPASTEEESENTSG